MPKSIEIDRSLLPEDAELAARRQELDLLQAELADCELFLANLRAQLAAFEGRYLREVGALYAELDDWNAKVAECAAKVAGTEEAEAAAIRARAQAQESYAAAHSEASKAKDFSPSPEVSEQFRRVAKAVHPDLAADEADRTLRERLMAEANAARRRGDVDALRKILDEYMSSPESVTGQGSLADLQRIVRQIDRARKRLAAIEAEIAELNSSEIALLMAKVETARATGRDLIAEMKKDLHYRVVLARQDFETQRSEANPA